MANPATQRTTGQKAVRMALIPALAAVLLAVVFWPDGQDNDPVIDSPDNAAQASVELDSERRVSDELDALTTRRQLQRMELSRILEHDPFALPSEVSDVLNAGQMPTGEQEADRERKRIAAVVEGLKREKLRVVYRDDKGVSALLGNRVLHVGDEIETGIRILKITPQGLTLEVSSETAPETAVE